MKAQCDINWLSQAVDLVSKAQRAPSSHLPILHSYKLEAKDGLLSVTATDMRAWAQVSVPCEVVEDGVAVVSSHLFGKLLHLLKETGEAEATITMEGGMLGLITATSSHFFETLPADEFPSFGVGDSEVPIDVAPAELGMALKVATAATNKEFPDVVLDADGKNLNVFATDTFRLIITSFPSSVKFMHVMDVAYVPLMVEGLKEAQPFFTERHQLFGVRSDSLRAVVAHKQATVPQYKNVLERAESLQPLFVVPCDELYRKLQRLSVHWKHDHRYNVPDVVVFHGKKGTVHLTVHNYDGDVIGREKLDVDGEWEGSISLNPKFITDYIDALPKSVKQSACAEFKGIPSEGIKSMLEMRTDGHPSRLIFMQKVPPMGRDKWML